jgi:hypothetical protein
MAKHCRSNMPKFLLYPSTTLFVFMVIGYGLSAITFCDMNPRHQYQRYFLLSGILTGFGMSLYLYLENTALNVVTTVMPTSITMFLVFSGLVHWMLGMDTTLEEKVYRRIECWAKQFPVSDSSSAECTIEGKEVARLDTL